jgi:alkylation response protein AidB-like acyl-CoA dehydrogenase
MTNMDPEELANFRGAVARFMAAQSPEHEVRKAMATIDGVDLSVWRRLAGELGLTGVAVPEQFGGAGCSMIELAVVLDEAARALLCAPLFSTTVLATTALTHCGDSRAQAEYLPPIAAGDRTATVAMTPETGDWLDFGAGVQATRNGRDWTLSGSASFVLDGATADLVLVAASIDGSVGLFALPGTAEGLTRYPLPTLDQTRKQALLTFKSARARLIGGGSSDGEALLTRVFDNALVALAAEQAGAAAHVLAMSVEYARNRVQFGRPISSFQAIKHRCADMLVDVEAAHTAVYLGLSTIASDLPDRSYNASLAKAYCSEVFMNCADANIHIHGGIGFTWEHPANLYFKRAKSSELLFGDPTIHLERMARLTTFRDA